MSDLPHGFRNQAYRCFDPLIDEISAETADYTDSPIERALAAAFLILSHTHYGEAAIHERGYESTDAPFPRFDWIMKCQYPIGKYRADFLIGGNPLRKTCQVVVECDGHNFHERTKQQAQRDRSRDREMQAAGYKVFRFTGAEIYRDAFGCAIEVFEALLSMQDEENQTS